MPQENDNYIITYNFIVLGESLLKKNGRKAVENQITSQRINRERLVSYQGMIKNFQVQKSLTIAEKKVIQFSFEGSHAEQLGLMLRNRGSLTISFYMLVLL